MTVFMTGGDEKRCASISQWHKISFACLTSEKDRLDVLVTLVAAYERIHFPKDLLDPVEAIKFGMGLQGLTVDDPVLFIGQKVRICEDLNRKRSLALQMIQGLHQAFDIPAESLIRQ